jgi:hypothetical protein
LAGKNPAIKLPRYTAVDAQQTAEKPADYAGAMQEPKKKK